jgi:hypothetical protein
MQALFALILIILAFAFGLILEPQVASKWNVSEQLNSARDALGLCGGTTPCEPAAMSEPAAAPPAEPAPAEAPPASAPPP